MRLNSHTCFSGLVEKPFLPCVYATGLSDWFVCLLSYRVKQLLNPTAALEFFKKSTCVYLIVTKVVSILKLFLI